MNFATVRDLKNKTSRILEQSHKGKEVVITRHGNPYALLVPVDEESLEDFILVKHFNMERAFIRIKKAYSRKTLMTLDQKIELRRRKSSHD